jgi:hypothetical protein
MKIIHPTGLLFLCSFAVGSPSVLAQTTPPVQPIIIQPQKATNQIILPANTEIIMSMNEDLTTKGGRAEEGTMFYLTVVSDVKVGDTVVIPRGSRGGGEVTWKTGKAVFGKSGKMDVELRYVELGGQRIEVEGKYRQEGEGSTVAAVGAAIIAAPLLIITGKSAKIPRGRELVARTKYDVPISIASGPLESPSPQPVPQADPPTDVGVIDG